MTKSLPLVVRDSANYRFWLSISDDPVTLRTIGMCACEDLDDALDCLRRRSDSPGQMTLHLEVSGGF